jgi:hypothetical protein
MTVIDWRSPGSARPANGRLRRERRLRRVLVVATRSGEGPFTHPLQTSIIVQRKPVAC